MKIYVGNLDAGTTSEELRALFEAFGNVSKADVHTVGYSGAFGRVEMPSSEEGQKAIDSLFGTAHRGQKLVVAECFDRGDVAGDDFDDDEDFEDEDSDD